MERLNNSTKLKYNLEMVLEYIKTAGVIWKKTIIEEEKICDRNAASKDFRRNTGLKKQERIKQEE